MIEEKLFKTEDEFKDFLMALGISQEKIEYLLEHEKSHFEKAVQLGYSPLYGLRYKFDKNGLRWKDPFTRVPGLGYNLKHFRLVLSAPKELSKRDKLALKDLGGLYDS